MSKAVHVTPSGKINVVPIGESSENTQLQDLQAYVGGLIEAVYLNNDTVMYVNEEGLVRGYWPNKWASQYANDHCPIPEHIYYIVGEVVIVGIDAEGEGDITDAPQELIDLAMAKAE